LESPEWYCLQKYWMLTSLCHLMKHMTGYGQKNTKKYTVQYEYNYTGILDIR